MLLGPFEDRHAGQLGAGVAHDRVWLAAYADQPRQLARDPDTLQRCVRHQRQTFAGEVVDHAQYPEPPATHQAIRHEVQAPALVRPFGQRHRCPRAQRPLATTSAANLQPFLAIYPQQLLVVGRQPLARQQISKSAIAEPAALGGQFPQPCA